MNGSLCTIIRDSGGRITAIEVEARRPGRRDRELKKLNQPAARLYHARTLAARRWFFPSGHVEIASTASQGSSIADDVRSSLRRVGRGARLVSGRLTQRRIWSPAVFRRELLGSRPALDPGRRQSQINSCRRRSRIGPTLTTANVVRATRNAPLPAIHSFTRCGPPPGQTADHREEAVGCVTYQHSTGPIAISGPSRVARSNAGCETPA